MDVDLADEIITAADDFIAGRETGDVIHALYHRTAADIDAAFDALVGLVPSEEIATVQMVGKLKLSDLQTVVILLATLGKIRTREGWIHYNLSKHLSLLVVAGVAEAKLPAIIHSLLSLEGLKENLPVAKALPLGVLARELGPLAPREALRHGVLATRDGHPLGLQTNDQTLRALGLDVIIGRPTIDQLFHIAGALRFDVGEIPLITNVDKAGGMRSTIIEPAKRVVFPPVRGDASHYIFRNATREVNLPAITMHTLEDGVFSISAAPGLEQQYVYDRDGLCVLDLANGSSPFKADTVIEYDGPVAVLDDRFSGAMNICHFLLDRLSRIPLYERASSQPCRFFVVDKFEYYLDIFDRIGLADRIITPPSIRASIRASQLLVSSNTAADFRHPAHYCADWAIDYLRSVFRVEQQAARPSRKILISRADTKGRGILNWSEVVSAAVRRGFEAVVLTGLPIEEQIALFRDAAQVVGVHGAGLTNILFAPRDCSVLEILPPMVATPAYWLLASSLGQRYTALIAEDVELPRPDYTSWEHNAKHNGRDIVVPIERLEVALTSL